MNHPKHERTYVMVKPDGVKRQLVGEILGRIEGKGLTIAFTDVGLFPRW